MVLRRWEEYWWELEHRLVLRCGGWIDVVISGEGFDGFVVVIVYSVVC